MPLPLDRDKTQKLTEELEQVIAAHLGWFKQFMRALVCGGCVDVEIAPDAFRKTPFGDWYYGKASQVLADHAIFQNLAEIQQAMHECARKAMETVKSGQRLPPELHDQCVDLALKLNTKLRQLQLEIIGDLLATDPLTGCYSRRGMIGRLQAEQERAYRIQRPCTLCLLDFDRFKKINDEYGHPAGDAVLKQGMRFVSGVLRKYDIAFRYGGEEFLLCLPGTSVDDAAQVIERVRFGLEKLPILLPNKGRMNVTASFGLAEILTTKPVEDTIGHADEALLRAKQNGRNRVEVWRPE